MADIDVGGWRRRAWRAVWSVSVRAKILGMVLALVALLSVSTGLIVRASLVDELRADLQSQALAVASHVAADSGDPRTADNPAELAQLLHRTFVHTLDARYILVVDGSGRLVASEGDRHMVDTVLPLLVAPITAPGAVRSLNVAEGRVWEATMPIGDATGRVARVGLGEERLWATMTNITSEIGVSTVFFALAAILAAYGLTWLLTQPILNLVAVTERVGRGDYTARAAQLSSDEIGVLAATFNRMIQRLSEAEADRTEHDRLRQSYLSAIIRAQEVERRRIARELHDETGQALASLMVGLRNAEAAQTPAETRRQLHDLRQITVTTMDHVRRLALDLRPSVLDDLGLVAALRRYTHDYQQHFGITVELTTVGLEGWRAIPEVETTVYRIVQEAMTNAVKYAQCTLVSVLLQLREGQLSVIVEDNGRGFDVERALADGAERGSLGLFGMQERATLVGGQLDLESEPGAGTTVYLRIPVADAGGAE